MIYNVVVNKQATNYSVDNIKSLLDQITISGGRYFIAEPESSSLMADHIKYILRRKPNGLIVCGGDGTVNLAGRIISRRLVRLGILPLGRFNNIYHSLYGEPKLKNALTHITRGKEKHIDTGSASGHFFLGSVGLGLFPELYRLLESKKTPRFGIGWSRLASQAAAEVIVKQLTLKLDEFQFDLTPQMISINLLPFSVGLPVTPTSLPDDGKCEVIFDVGQTSAIMSGYIRALLKRKYIYSNEIRMFRARKIVLYQSESRPMYIDGELIESPPELDIEVQSKRLRIFYADREKG